jgi:hypothetical protein
VEVGTVIVKIDEPEPGAAIYVGRNFAVAPDGNAETLKPISALKPREALVLIVTACWDPCGIVTEFDEAEMVKGGAGCGGEVWIGFRMSLQ